jgi:hypothetical protein
MTNEIMQNQIERKKLELEVLKICLTFVSITVAIEVFIIGNQGFPDWLKLIGLIVLAIFLVLMKNIANDQLKEIRNIFNNN